MQASKKPLQRRAADLHRLPGILTAGLFCLLAIIILYQDFQSPITFTMYNSGTITYERGEVVAVLSEQLEPASGLSGWQLGNQEIMVKVKTGELKGQLIQFNNSLSTTHNIYVKTGQAVLIKADCPVGVEPYFSLYNYDRLPGMCTVALVLVAFMVLVGHLKGLKSVLGLAISLFFILAFLLPAIYGGHSPVLMAALTVMLIAAFSLLLLNGFSRKTATAVVATAIGVVLSALFFFLLSALLHLSGNCISEAEELILISQNTGLQLGQVLFAGVLISSLGAVMDTTMSISASLYEMRALHPDTPAKTLFHSGIVIGRDMIGTMCQTLVLAFVGSSLATLLVLVSYGTSFDQFISSDYAAIEVVQAVSGSLAVIFAVPVTAALCAWPHRSGIR